MRRKERRRSKSREKEAMHSKIAHRPLTDAQPFPKQPAAPHGQLPPVYVLGRTFLGVENPLASWGQLCWLCSLSAPCAPARAGESAKSLPAGEHCSAPAEVSLRCQHYSHNPKMQHCTSC